MDLELLKKYDMTSLEWYQQRFGDSNETSITFYKTFLMQTDYIPNKLIESKVLGIECSDYTKELEAREYCRKQIRRLTGQEVQL